MIKTQRKTESEQVALVENIGELIEVLSKFDPSTPFRVHTKSCNIFGSIYPTEVCLSHTYFPDQEDADMITLYGRSSEEHPPHTDFFIEQEKIYLGKSFEHRADGRRRDCPKIEIDEIDATYVSPRSYTRPSPSRSKL